MSFLKKILGKNQTPVTNAAEFWNWFRENEAAFFNVIKSGRNPEKPFFDKISEKLSQLREGYFFLAGMPDENTVELVLTADGNLKNIHFVEELVAAAPKINRWMFTALKQPIDIDQLAINMGNFRFDSQNIFFYSNVDDNYPDLIDITVVHNDLNDSNRGEVANGTYIFLDNALGELDFAEKVDNITIVGKSEVQAELVPISKLPAFLNWREKEFVEKYQSVGFDSETSTYSTLEAQLESGNNLVAIINTELLNWDYKASHPWIAILTIDYDGRELNGMPSREDYQLLDELEDEIVAQLPESQGYLNVGRQTAENQREIYFACREFRKPSKVLYEIQQKYAGRFEMKMEIFKDKYWQVFDRFIAN